MELQTLTQFFMWSSILNGSILILWTGLFMFAPNLVYRLQSFWFPIPREKFTVVMYSFLGVFKLLFIIFNITPYLALLIIAG
ncbi:DUF6868 family protein [Thiomicrorhabdus arctica]|uniref:DUF6868 family protein n=1 Tax=Thiomicrorhabdus arctica TaxID=131540 RepID=UPI000377656F|nr:hypothetical protein [Thiomicrorhabdus arctica]